MAVNIKRTGLFLSALKNIQRREKIYGLVVLRNLMEQMGFEHSKEGWNQIFKKE